MQDNEEIQFFTATILEWKHLLKPDKYKDVIIESLKFLSTDNRVDIFALAGVPSTCKHPCLLQVEGTPATAKNL